jgi:hypothetical protein
MLSLPSVGLGANRRLAVGKHRPPAIATPDLDQVARRSIAGVKNQADASPAIRVPCRSGGHPRQVPYGEHAHFGEPRLGDRAHAPHQLDRQVVKEIQLGASQVAKPDGW